MIKMDENLKNKYQDVINYENADSMFTALDNLLKENDRKFVLTEEHDTEENCIRSYVLRSNAMRYANLIQSNIIQKQY